MPIRVWCRTLDLLRNPVLFSVDIEPSDDSGVCIVDDLRLRLLFDPPPAFCGEHVHVYADVSAKEPLPPNTPLDGLGHSESEPLRIQPFDQGAEICCEYRRYHFKPSDHRPRPKLLRRLFNMVSATQFTFVEAHAQTGKTALVDMMAHAYCDRYTFRLVDLEHCGPSPQAAKWLRMCSDISLETGQVPQEFPRSKPTIVVIKHAEHAYHDKSFWKQLLVDATQDGWLPTSYRFMFLAKPVIGRDHVMPRELLRESVARLKPEDILLSDEEAKRKILGADKEVFAGRELPLEITVRACGGIPYLLPMRRDIRLPHESANDGSDDATRKRLLEHEVVRQLLSLEMAHGSIDNVKLTPVRTLLMRCLGSAPEPTPIVDSDDYDVCAALVAHGLLEPCGEDGTDLRLLGSLREKAVLSKLFPVRSFLPTTSLDTVLRQAIARLKLSDQGSAAVSTATATIRALFLEGLTLATDDKCSVCPELARVFPASHEAHCSACQQDQCTDIYMGGRVKWGIQLRVRLPTYAPPCTSECSHPSPFSPTGRYGVLKVREQQTVIVELAKGVGESTRISCCIPSEEEVQPSSDILPVATTEPPSDGSSPMQAPEAGTKLYGPLVASAKPNIPRDEWYREPRTELIKHMRRLLFDDTTPNRLICLTGPHGIGKSALAYLFRRQLDYDEVNMAWHEIRHDQVPDGIEPLGAATFAMRRDARIELMQRLTDLQPSTPSTMHVVFLDNAHLVFGETSFWTALETAIESWLPANVRFIIAATTLSSTSDLPSMLNKYPRIDQDELKLPYANAREYLLRNSDGADADDTDHRYDGELKQWSFKKDSLVDVLIRASNGSVGLLDSLVKGLVERDRVDPQESERGLVRSFFSEKISTRMAKALKLDDEATRCGLQSLRALTFRYEIPHSSVSRAFALAAHDTPIADAAAEPKVKELLDLGLVVLTPEGSTDATGYRLAFPSPCAKRLTMACAFTHPDERQTLSKPTTPSSLIKSILHWIGSLESAATTASCNGTIVTQFYERFIESLTRSRDFESDVYPELLDVFPCTASEASHPNDPPPHATAIEIDVNYAVDGRTRWGLQVRITDQDPQTLAAPVRRFAPGQRYGVLRVDDAMVVDIVLVEADAELEPPVDEKQKRMVVYYDIALGTFMASSTGGDKRRRKRRKRG